MTNIVACGLSIGTMSMTLDDLVLIANVQDVGLVLGRNPHLLHGRDC